MARTWKEEDLDYVGNVRLEAIKEAERTYSEEDRFRIMLNKDDDPESFEKMKTFFNDLWQNRDADIESHDGKQESVMIDFSAVSEKLKK